ncbi:MAG: hypothetical protein IAI49_04490, partial [Candidatus Eremiobacteraeota bacterium]|nr:hypothetical protein [Candidatus Eremiobacteraeota bacterium]
MDFDCLVVGSHLRFDGVRQRPQQIVTRLGRRVPVLFVETPLLAEGERDDIHEVEGIDVLRALRPVRASDPDERTLACVRRWVGERRALV